MTKHADRDKSEQPVWPPHARAAYLDEPVPYVPAESAEVEVRAQTFAEVSHAMNLVADIWERDGSDPCRVRITREYANAYRLYAEGHGAPTGSAKFRAALDGAE